MTSVGDAFASSIASATLPMDLVLYIMEFVRDIDIRRHFGIYRRIPRGPIYNTIAYIVRTPNPHGSTVLVDNYILPNVSDIPFRRDHNIENDMVDMGIEETANAVELYVGIYRLRLKTGESSQESETGLNRFFFKGNHPDYYWSYLLYRYIIQ